MKWYVSLSTGGAVFCLLRGLEVVLLLFRGGPEALGVCVKPGFRSKLSLQCLLGLSNDVFNVRFGFVYTCRRLVRAELPYQRMRINMSKSNACNLSMHGPSSLALRKDTQAHRTLAQVTACLWTVMDSWTR